MSNIRRAGYAGLLGAFFAIASLLAFPGLLRLVERPDSAIRVEANDVAPGPFLEIKGGEGRQLYIDGASGSLMSPVAPGLHHIAWKQSYRGGHERSVGYAQLVGPFQDPRTPTCGLALLIAPAFLDQTSPVLEKVVARQLKGLSQWPVGDFRNVTDTTMNWIRWEEHPPPKVRRAQVEAPLAGQRLNGHLRVSMNVEFENAMVPLSLMVVPYILGESLKFHIYVSMMRSMWLKHCCATT